jgi:hypothetical protein
LLSVTAMLLYVVVAGRNSMTPSLGDICGWTLRRRFYESVSTLIYRQNLTWSNVSMLLRHLCNVFSISSGLESPARSYTLLLCALTEKVSKEIYDTRKIVYHLPLTAKSLSYM